MTIQYLVSDHNALPTGYAFAQKLGFHGSPEEWNELLEASRTPRSVDADTDLSSLRPRRYRVEHASTARALGLPVQTPGLLDKLPSFSTRRIYCFRTLPKDGLPATFWMTSPVSDRSPEGQWWLVELASDKNKTPSEQILDLAQIDGWTAVYDPTNATTTVTNSLGEIQTVADGLNHLPPLSLGRAEDTVLLVEGEFGLLHGLQTGYGTLSTIFADVQRLRQPNTIITLARSTTSDPGQRFLFDGVRKSRQTVHTRDEPGAPLSIWSGSGSPGGNPTDTEPHLFTATFHGSNSRLGLDSRTYRADSDRKSNRTLGGLTLGGDHQGARRWDGSIGPTLIRQGEMPEDGRIRMENLIYRLSGLRPQSPQFPDDVIVYSADSSGHPTVTHGPVDTVVDEPGIASLTKMMTAWLTRQAFSTGAELTEKAEILATDRHKYSYRRFLRGDLVSHEDLLRAMMMASDNTAPYTLARVLGERLHCSQDPVGMFVDEMNAEAARLGYQGAEFTTPWNFGRMSAVQIADLHLKMLEDDVLVNAMGLLYHDVSIDGPRQRIQPIQHQLSISPAAPVVEMQSAKTGTWPKHGRRHISYAWKHFDGSTHVTVVLNARSQRIRDFALRSASSWIQHWTS